MAPTLYQVEESYRDKVNFIMVNGDDPNNWPIIEALGVDAIPHLAFVESDGTVDTALIGPVPKDWLDRNIDTLLENAADTTTSSSSSVVAATALTNCDKPASTDGGGVDDAGATLNVPETTSSSPSVAAAA